MNRINKRWMNQRFPEFSLTDEDGNTSSNSCLIGKWSVIFFYPKDDSPGCTIQAATFAKFNDSFAALNCQVIGVSSGSQQSHKDFQCNNMLPYPLLSDKKARLHRTMELGKTLGWIPKRVTFVVDEMGFIRYVFDSQFAVKKHVSKVLAFLKTASNISKIE